MSKLLFDNSVKKIFLYNAQEKELGNWEAYNNPDSTSSLKFVPDGVYIMQDQTTPFRHPSSPEDDTTEGKYGAYGIVRFYITVDGQVHSGVGVHSGRAHYSTLKPGPQYWTKGCIRTTDEAMKMISETMQKDSLKTIEVIHNTRSTKG